MFVCVCAGANEEAIHKIIDENPDITVDDFEDMNICHNCYRCRYVIEEILEKRGECEY